MKFSEIANLPQEDKQVLKAIFDLTVSASAAYAAIQGSRYDNLKRLSYGQLEHLITNTIDYDADFDGELNVGELAELEDML